MGLAGPDPYPFEFQLLDEDWEHFSVLMESALHRIPALADTGSGSSTTARRASPRTTSSSSARRRSCGTSSSAAGFNSVGIASAGGAGRALARMDHRRRAGHRPARRGHPAVRAVQREQPVAARPGRRGPRPALRRAVAEPRAADRPAVPPVARLPPAGGPGAASAAGWAGSGPTSSRRPAPTRPSSTAGASRTGCRGRPPSSAPPAARSPCSTRPRSPSTCYRPGCRARPAVAVHRRCRRAAGPDVYTGMLNARGTYESDITVTRLPRQRVPDGQQRGDDGAGHGLHPPPLPAGCAPAVATSPRLRGLRRDGPALARAVGRLTRRRPQDGRSPSAPAADRPRRRHRPRDQDHLRRRARLGAVRARGAPSACTRT